MLLSMTLIVSKSELQKARNELEQMLVEVDVLQVRIAKQKRVIAALTELANIEEDSEPPATLVSGTTDACKTAVLGATTPIFPSDVRDRILALGFPPQKNLLASVHTVLKRLAESGQIKEDKGAYRKMSMGERMVHLSRQDAAIPDGKDKK
jgi:hypothetical protein